MEDVERTLEDDAKPLAQQLAAENQTSAILRDAYDSLRQDLVGLASSGNNSSEDLSAILLKYEPSSVLVPAKINEHRRKAVALRLIATQTANVLRDKTMADLKERIDTLEVKRGVTCSKLEEDTTMLELLKRCRILDSNCVTIRKDVNGGQIYAKSFNHVRLPWGAVGADMVQVNSCCLQDLPETIAIIGRLETAYFDFYYPGVPRVQFGRIHAYDQEKQAGAITIELFRIENSAFGYKRPVLCFDAVIAPISKNLYDSLPHFEASRNTPAVDISALIDHFSHPTGQPDAAEIDVCFTRMFMEPMDGLTSYLIGAKRGRKTVNFDTGQFAVFVASALQDDTILNLVKTIHYLEYEPVDATAWVTGPESSQIYAEFLMLDDDEWMPRNAKCAFFTQKFSLGIPIQELLSVQVNFDNTFSVDFSDIDEVTIIRLGEHDDTTNTGSVEIVLGGYFTLKAEIGPISFKRFDLIPDYDSLDDLEEFVALMTYADVGFDDNWSSIMVRFTEIVMSSIHSLI